MKNSLSPLGPERWFSKRLSVFKQRLSVAFTVLACLTVGSTMNAASYTWDGGAGNGFWGDAVNWIGDSGFPNSASDSASTVGLATFADSSGVDSSFTVNSLSNTTGANNLSLTNVVSGTGALIFESLTGTANLNTFKNSGRTANVNVGVVLNSNLVVLSRGAVGVTFLKGIQSGLDMTTGLTINGTQTGDSQSTAYVTIGAASTYTGTTAINGNISTTVPAGGGRLRIGGDDYLPTTTVLSINPSNAASNAQGGRFSLNGFNQTVAGLSGVSGTSSGLVTNDIAASTTGTLIVNNSENFSFAGTIADAVTAGNLGITALTKSGSGEQTLTGNNSYTGATTITAGTLVVGVAGIGSLGDTEVGVESAGALAGSGSIGGPVVLSGSLAPGNGAAGTLTITNSLTMVSSALTLLELGGDSIGQYDRVIGLTDLTLEGTILVSLLSYNPVAGNTFDLFNWTGTLNSGGFDLGTDLLLPTLDSGLTWDTSAFLISGVISVVPEPSSLLLFGFGVLLLLRRKEAAR